MINIFQQQGILMGEWWSGLADPQLAFLRYALGAGLLASVAFGVVGTLVVSRQISTMAGAIAHSSLGGIGLALYVQSQGVLLGLTPLVGALGAALIAALVMGMMTMQGRQREDTAIGVIWAVGMAIGLLFLAETPRYVDPMAYLFGDILLIREQDLWLLGGLDGVVVVVSFLFYPRFLAICFDEEFARSRGVAVFPLYLLLLGLTAVTVVLLSPIVGIVMVIALLTIPAAMAGCFVRKMGQMMILASLFCMVFVGAGLALSYEWDLRSGPTIILVAGVAYLGVLIWGKAKQWVVAFKGR